MRSSPVALGAVVLVVLLATVASLPAGRASAPLPAAPAGGGGAARPTGPALPGTGMTAAAAHALLAGISAAHVPSRYVFLPNLEGREVRHGNVVTPLYDLSPAPMGVADLGVRNTTGTAVPTLLTTASFEGTADFTNASVFYLDNDAPDYLGLQLNTVLANVTLLGSPGYVFWNQNVVSWSARSHLLQFVDNIWNLSDPTGLISPNVFVSSNGTLVAPSFYYALGPVINVSLPFTLDLYTNATIQDQGGYPYDSVWFNFTVRNASGVFPGSFDHVVFDSQAPAAPVASIPAPVYEVNGATPTPTGYLPYDAEFVLGGPGGGSTTSVLALNATFALRFLNTTSRAYEVVPTALGYGTDTGETIEGVGEWYDAQGTVHLGAGPSVLLPMWNASPAARPGAIDLTGTIAPSTAFVFVNASRTFSPDAAAWAPVPPGGRVDYRLSPGNYSGEILASGRDPATFTVNASSPASWVLPGALTPNASRGVYTPLVAWGNAQLSELAVAGNGSAANPYLLPSASPGLDPVFGRLNDFTFPVFPGLLLLQTTAHVDADAPPAFAVNYTGANLATIEALSLLFGLALPTSNDLQVELYGCANASVFGAAGVSGWFSPFLNGYPLANLMLWNDTGVLVGGSRFVNEGSSLLLYGGAKNVLWGNTFEGGPAAATLPVFGASVVELSVFGSNNTIFDNAFTPSPDFAASTLLAQSPATTPYTETYYSGNAARYVNAWNVSARPAAEVSFVNGYALYGSIVGGPVQGGNFWSDYGSAANPTGRLPYNESGAIAVGGDYLPLTLPAPFTTNVTFTEAGLPAGTTWTVDLNGVSRSSAGSSVVFAVPNGSFSFVIVPVAGLSASPSSGSFGVAGVPVVVGVSFLPGPTQVYPVAFAETGLPAGTNWSVGLAGASDASTRDTITFLEPNGTYAFSVGAPANFTVLPGTGNVSVAGASATVAVAFAPLPGTLVVTLNPSGAVLSVDGVVASAVNGTVTLSLAPGLHSVRATSAGYLPYANNISIAPAGVVVLAIALAAPAATAPAGGPTGANLALLIGVTTLAVIFLIGMVYFWTRSPRRPAPAPPAGAGGASPP